MALRDQYNNDVYALQSGLLGGMPVGTYEDQVNRMVATYGGEVSPQEIGDNLYNLYAQFGPAPSGKYYGERLGVKGDSTSTVPYTPPVTTTGTGTDTTALNQSIADLEAQKAYVQSQFEPLYAKYLQDLEASKASNADTLNKDYWKSAELNDQRYGEGLQNIQRGYAARGIGDSSYKENAVSGLNSDFKNVYGDLTSQKEKGMGDLNKQYNEKLTSAQAMRNNFYNPDKPVYTDASQVATASTGLNNALDTARNQLSNANLAGSSINSNLAGNDPLFQEYAKSQVEAGTPWGTVADNLKTKGVNINDPSYDAYLSYLYGSKESDPYKYLNPAKAKYLY